MTLPALENGPYVFNVNNYFEESSFNDKCKRQLLELKNGLVALGGAGVIWQVIASCDATDVKQIGDADPDLWDTIADVNFSTGAHSWCILENQTTGGMLLIDYDTGYVYRTIMEYSPGGLYPSATGTNTTPPTATDSTRIMEDDKNFSADSTFNRAFVLHIMTSADHKTTRWYWHESLTSNGSRGGFFGCIEELTNTPSEWTSTNKVAVFGNDVATPFALTTDPVQQTPTLASFLIADWKAYFKTAAPFEDWVTGLLMTYEFYKPLSQGLATTSGIFQRHINLEVAGGLPISPMGLYNKASGANGGSFGRFRDLYLAPAFHQTMTTYPADTSRLWLKIGCFLVPWNGTAPLFI